MTISQALYSSDRGDWGTPQAFFDKADQEFRFDCDAAANATNAKCDRYYSTENSALAREYWTGRVWCNPPYGRNVNEWLDRGASSVRMGTAGIVVFLLPARVDTRWFHAFAPRCETRLIKGRLRFEGAAASAPFPSMLMIFGKDKAGQIGTMGQ